MKPPAFNFVDYAKLQSEMDKRNAYTNVLKAENTRLNARVKTLLTDAEQAAQTEQAMLKRLEELEKENKTLRNELCLQCGRYVDAHNGSCNGCRWKKEDKK